MSEQCPKCGEPPFVGGPAITTYACGTAVRASHPEQVDESKTCLRNQLTQQVTAHQNLIAKCAAVDSLAVDGAAHVHPGNIARACKALNEWQQAWAGGGG
jgi:hypothetical protein